MSNLVEYKNLFKYIKFQRKDGILEMALHRDGEEAQWEAAVDGIHTELGTAFYYVGRDLENKVVIFTGTGENFLSKYDMSTVGEEKLSPFFWDRIYKEGKDLLQNLMEIEVPIIGAINGCAHIHSELICLSDIVICSEDTFISDSAHAPNGTVPGDGVHVVWPMLLGPNRGRYFLLTGEHIDAGEAKRLGVVAEILPKDELLGRAWKIAEQMIAQPPLMLRYSRVALTQHIKRRLADDLGYGLALEGLAALSRLPY